MSQAIKELLGDELIAGGGKKVPISYLNGKIVALYFSAHWCPPCRQFTPLLAQTYDTLVKAERPFEIVFISSDQEQTQFDSYFATMPWKSLPYTDRLRKNAISEKFNVKGIPTLIVLGPDGEVVSSEARNEVAKSNAKAFETWATTANLEGFSSSTSGGPAPEAVGNVECLNEKKKGSCKEIVKTSATETTLESDSDEQLLLTIHFMSDAKLTEINISAPTDGRAPSKIHLFLNLPNMDFSNAEREKPTQVLEFKAEDFVDSDGKGKGTAKVNLQFVKFQKVSSLTFFVLGNVGGGEVTAVSGIHCFGPKN